MNPLDKTTGTGFFNKRGLMTKRELLHVLLDELLNIEDTTKRGVDFEYSTLLGVQISVTSSVKNYTDRIRPCFREYDLEKYGAERVLAEIGLINETPDKEPVFSFTLTEARAKELGLIA